MKVLFLSGDVIYRSGYRRRVLSELEALTIPSIQDRHPLQLHFLSFLSPMHLRSLFSMDSSQVKLAESGVNVYQAPSLPNAPWPSLYLNLLWMTIISGFVVKWKKIELIHAQNLYSAFIALILKKLWGIRYVFDMHGLVPEESLYKSFFRRHASFKVLKWMEAKCVVNADCILCVSQAFSHYLQNQHKANANDIKVIPNGVDRALFNYDGHKRKELREGRGFEHRLVVLYAGNVGQWHAEAKLVELFREITAQRENAFFLILTPTPTKRLAYLLSSGGDMEAEENYSVLSVAHHEVPSYSLMADIALLVRDRNKVNEVACPTKFVEYLACGVPILASSGVGDIDNIMRQHEVGVTFETDDPVDRRKAIKKILNLLEEGDRLKKRCAWVAQQTLSWELNMHLVVDVYDRVGES